jgi:shikimate kinase
MGVRIYLIGFMGSGKTYRGRQLSEKLGLPFFDLDEQIVNHVGKSVAEIFAEQGEESFRLIEKNTLQLITQSHQSFIMSCGGGTPCYFENMAYMKQQGVVVWINTPTAILFNRLIKEKEKRPLIKDLSNNQLLDFINKKLADRKLFYEQSHRVLQEEDLSLDAIILKIFNPS